ncbi:MAG: hypothetical protein KatS3mg109_0262 [Pirellulaceae bacterium]|nr:MAG: hypothetical protein KatS3mg109_0262 [Pirellulaceae bacterium]
MTNDLSGRIRQFTLAARKLLTSEASEQLEGVYGFLPSGRLKPVQDCPVLAQVPEAAQTRQMLERLLQDEQQAGIDHKEAREKLVREAAFTWLNRLVAFKMLEARKVIRQTVSKGPDSNGFKLWLVEAGNEAHLADYEAGDLPQDALGEGPRQRAYRRFLLARCAELSGEVRVLFDPATLPSRLFPRPHALKQLLDLLNAPNLADAWQPGNEETIGWVYQFFIEDEKKDVFHRLYNKNQKIRARDIPAATQIFTPRWIVRCLVENTLGRLWLELHPDSELRQRLEYLVPINEVGTRRNDEVGTMNDEVGTRRNDEVGTMNDEVGTRRNDEVGTRRNDEVGTMNDEGKSVDAEGSSFIVHRSSFPSVRDLRLLDPACGTMHFGLVAFDLFVEMYREEMARAGQPGWPEKPPVQSADDIPAAILAHNIHGIDIDLRAVQLSALTLYLKAKSLNPKARLTESRLACADIHMLDGDRLAEFLRTAGLESRPIYGRILKALQQRLKDADQLGSLLRLEDEIRTLIEQERERYEREGRQPDLFGWTQEQFETEAGRAEFWETLEIQIGQALDAFAREQAEAGRDQSFFAGETTKGLRLLEIMAQRYDVVVTNPPYMSARNMNPVLKHFLAKEYNVAKGDLYAAFIQRCTRVAGRRRPAGHGDAAVVHVHQLVRKAAGVAARADCDRNDGARRPPGVRGSDGRKGEHDRCSVFRRESDAAVRDASVGVYFRLVKEPDAEAKRRAFELALRNDEVGTMNDEPKALHRSSFIAHRYKQSDFDAIPGSPWVYWITPGLRRVFQTFPKLGEIAQPRQGLATADNFRFLRYWWEVGTPRIAFGCGNAEEAKQSGKRWFPHMKGGSFQRWYGNQEYVVNWENDGAEIRNLGIESGKVASRPQNTEYYFRRGVTWSHTTSSALSARISPVGFTFNVEGPTSFPDNPYHAEPLLGVLNSSFPFYATNLINPTIHMTVGAVAMVPIPNLEHANARVRQLVERAIALAKADSEEDETTWDFVAPPPWNDEVGTMRNDEVGTMNDEVGTMRNDEVGTMRNDEVGTMNDEGIEVEVDGSSFIVPRSSFRRAAELAEIERQIDEEVYRLYGISDEDRAAIEAELGNEEVGTMNEEVGTMNEEVGTMNE